MAEEIDRFAQLSGKNVSEDELLMEVMLAIMMEYDESLKDLEEESGMKASSSID